MIKIKYPVRIGEATGCHADVETRFPTYDYEGSNARRRYWAAVQRLARPHRWPIYGGPLDLDQDRIDEALECSGVPG